MKKGRLVLFVLFVILVFFVICAFTVEAHDGWAKIGVMSETYTVRFGECRNNYQTEGAKLKRDRYEIEVMRDIKNPSLKLPVFSFVWYSSYTLTKPIKDTIPAIQCLAEATHP